MLKITKTSPFPETKILGSSGPAYFSGFVGMVIGRTPGKSTAKKEDFFFIWFQSESKKDA